MRSSWRTAVRAGHLSVPRPAAEVAPGNRRRAPAAGAGVPVASIVTPEIAITKSVKQIGFASVAYVAYWADTGEVVDSSGPSVGKAFRDDWWLFGFGPRTIGTIPPVDHQID